MTSTPQGLLSSNPFSYSLPQGLLHTIPEEVLGQAPQLPAYIEECADPKVSPNRLLPAASLSRLLEQLIHESWINVDVVFVLFPRPVGKNFPWRVRVEGG